MEINQITSSKLHLIQTSSSIRSIHRSVITLLLPQILNIKTLCTTQILDPLALGWIVRWSLMSSSLALEILRKKTHPIKVCLLNKSSFKWLCKVEVALLWWTEIDLMKELPQGRKEPRIQVRSILDIPLISAFTLKKQLLSTMLVRIDTNLKVEEETHLE